MRLTKVALAIAMAVLAFSAAPAWAAGLSATDAIARLSRQSAPAPQRAAASVYATAEDDNIPGVALPASAVAGTLDPFASDNHDVYAVTLEQGEWLYLELSGSAGTNFDLLVWDSTATNVNDTVNWAGLYDASLENDSSEQIMVFADVAGTYYVDVVADPAVTGGGSYTLTHSNPTNTPAVSLEAMGSTSLAYGGAARFNGTLVDSTSTAMQQQPVFVLKLPYGATDPVPVGVFYTDTAGGFMATDKPNIRTDYFAVFLGGFLYTDAISDPAVTVKVKAKVGTPVTPSRMYTTRSAKIHGYLSPKHAAGSKVRIYKYKLNGRKWEPKGYVTAKTSNISGDSTRSKYSVSLRLSTKGKWRLRATHEDGGHLKTSSLPSRSISVR